MQKSMVSLRNVNRGMAAILLLSSTLASHAAMLTAGSPPSSAPTTFLDTKTGKIEGFMPDVAREVAKREKLDVDFSAVPFPTLIQSVISGKIDMIVAGMTPTPAREKFISYSQEVTAFGDGLIVRDDNKQKYTDWKDFKGQTIGSPSGTDYAQKLINSGIAKEVKLYDSPADMTRDLQLGRIAGGLSDYPILKAQEKAGMLKGLHVVEGYQPMAVSPMAFGVKKGNDVLLAKINDALNAMKADGTLATLKSKWNMPQ
ncbi:ABC transporter substrate-binding protein [Rouxiella sp. S1S-2]|uniref:substrate-binding periplasmic protein n=1 Tax=Rouxiella sp. S1S-2 TaxID=2653856 RepID=UPI001D00816C|nr:transporter substrate-binding domain-containing protein [Rouxiella sp. S1S-2]